MILGYEQLDQNYKGWNFNGRYNLPYIDYKAKNTFQQEIIDSLINPRLDIKSHIVYLPFRNYPGLTELSIDNISDQKYFYPIWIYSPELFVDLMGQLSISPKVRSHIEKGQAKILLLFPSEGDQFRYLDKFKSIVASLNLNKNDIYFIHSDLAEEKWQGHNFHYRSCNHFLYSMGKFYTKFKNLEIKKDFRHLFLSYNRNTRPQRLILLNELVKNGLVDQGLISFRTPIDEFESVSRNIKERQNYTFLPIDHLKKYLEITLDQNTWQTTPAYDINPEHHSSTFLSLVTESVCDNTGIIFTTEKIFKPILLGHPFFLVGQRYYLAELRKLGFQTFGDFWSEEYDEIPHYIDRINHIVEQLQKLKKLDIQELNQIKTEMLPILNHNRTVLFKYLDQQIIPNNDLNQIDFHSSVFNVIKSLYKELFND